MINKIQIQIKQQTESVSALISNSKSLIGFNANTIHYNRTETIIQIKLNINEDDVKLNDKFDWEIVSELNE